MPSGFSRRFAIRTKASNRLWPIARRASAEIRAAAEGALQGALRQLFALAEAYPDLKANENFRQLQAELGDIENKIAAARRFFNNAAAEYNTARETFPAVLMAGTLGFGPQDFFNLDGEERKAASTAPKVQF